MISQVKNKVEVPNNVNDNDNYNEYGYDENAFNVEDNNDSEGMKENYHY